jgi:hypothetical protein
LGQNRLPVRRTESNRGILIESEVDHIQRNAPIKKGVVGHIPEFTKAAVT